MWKTAKNLLNSKKAMMAFVSAIVWGVAKAGLDMETEHVIGIVTPLWAYIFGQSLADHGKEKALAEKATPEMGTLGEPKPAADAAADKE